MERDFRKVKRYEHDHQRQSVDEEPDGGWIESEDFDDVCDELDRYKQVCSVQSSEIDNLKLDLDKVRKERAEILEQYKVLLMLMNERFTMEEIREAYYKYATDINHDIWVEMKHKLLSARKEKGEK